MQLEDGRFLISAQKYDKLLQSYSQHQLKHEMKLVRVSPNFRVIALALPVNVHYVDDLLRYIESSLSRKSTRSSSLDFNLDLFQVL